MLPSLSTTNHDEGKGCSYCGLLADLTSHLLGLHDMTLRLFLRRTLLFQGVIM